MKLLRVKVLRINLNCLSFEGEAGGYIQEDSPFTQDDIDHSAVSTDPPEPSLIVFKWGRHEKCYENIRDPLL